MSSRSEAQSGDSAVRVERDGPRDRPLRGAWV